MKQFCKKLKIASACFILIGICFVPIAQASSGMSLSIEPPLFQVNLGPGDHWASAIKVSNLNNTDETLFPSVLNFQIGENKLIPVTGESAVGNTYNLASWVTMSKSPITIKGGQSASVPFSLEIPKDAAPGDHYAALIIGTEGGNSNVQGANVSVASKLSSLLFIRVRGAIEEHGTIREFRSRQSLYQTADAGLIMKIENTGNVRLKPQGKIEIFNMWGKSRGIIPITEDAGFGNVLPKSVNQSVFSWGGEHNFFELGYYKAVATINYGDHQKTMTASTSFWVLPIINTLIVLLLLTFIVLFMIFSIRRFVRRSLRIEMERFKPASSKTSQNRAVKLTKEVVYPPKLNSAITLSISQLWSDIKKRKPLLDVWFNNSHTILVIIAILMMSLGSGIYFTQTLKASRDYKIIIHKDDGQNLQISNHN